MAAAAATAVFFILMLLTVPGVFSFGESRTAPSAHTEPVHRCATVEGMDTSTIWTATEVAKHHGVKTRTVYKWEARGKIKRVTTFLGRPLYQPDVARSVSPRSTRRPESE